MQLRLKWSWSYSRTLEHRRYRKATLLTQRLLRSRGSERTQLSWYDQQPLHPCTQFPTREPRYHCHRTTIVNIENSLNSLGKLILRITSILKSTSRRNPIYYDHFIVMDIISCAKCLYIPSTRSLLLGPYY